jgi:hypothetical protein
MNFRFKEGDKHGFIITQKEEKLKILQNQAWPEPEFGSGQTLLQSRRLKDLSRVEIAS